MIIDAIGEPALLEQLAEECTELAHACLKYARILRGENPTPVSAEDAQEQVILEAADVEVCMVQLAKLPWWSWSTMEWALEYKSNRWEERTNANRS